jgi:hypothetical protein
MTKKNTGSIYNIPKGHPKLATKYEERYKSFFISLKNNYSSKKKEAYDLEGGCK